MASPLVATKLFIPKRPPAAIERHRLYERLQSGARARLTLVSAPAGFGKTTLLAEWLASRVADDRLVAWLSLDQGDNEELSFWTHLIETIEKVASDNGATLATKPGPGQAAITVVLASLLNQVAPLPFEIDLVLDDFHLIDQASVHAGMEFLVEHLSPNLHLLISTRADPAIPLARLRAQGELVEIRSADLRFTPEEAAAYLNTTMGLALSERDMRTLGARTEGWIAALQLAALSMQGRADPSGFIESFAGNDRYVFDYLVEEVLARQTAEVRRFLIETCFLSRLSGPLCDAVTGRGGGQAMLEALDRANLFLVPLDDRRRWYRYHHLFADVLQTLLDDEARARLPELHRRAGQWHEQHGEPSEAIRHALAGRDLDRAAELIERAIPQMRRDRRDGTLRGWLRALPDTVVRSRPVLGVALVGVLVSNGELDRLPERLHDAESALSALAQPPPIGGVLDAPIVVDHDQLRGLPTQIALYRTALAQIGGDLDGVITHARTAIALAAPDDHLGRAGASGFLGIAFWTGGELPAALEAWTACRDGLRRAGHLADTLGVSVALADIYAVQGELSAAQRACESVLEATSKAANLPGQADVHTRLSELCRERSDLVAARQHLHDLGDDAGLPQHPYRWRVAMARLREAEGDRDAAVALLDEAERLYVSDFFPNVRPVPALRARVRIAQGQLALAEQWRRDVGVAVTDELSYLREFEHITFARLVLAQDASEAGAGPGSALPLIDRLLAAAARSGRAGSVIELSMLRALALRQSDGPAALVSLEKALTLAAPEGYVRLFVDEGPPMAALLKIAVKRRIAPTYAATLLAAFGAAEPKTADHRDLLEPLSERELDVLRLLRSDLGGPEIARELMVSLNTVRTHTKAIYEKLGVNSRRLAVRRADELDLLRNRPRQA